MFLLFNQNNLSDLVVKPTKCATRKQALQYFCINFKPALEFCYYWNLDMCHFSEIQFLCIGAKLIIIVGFLMN